MSCYSKKIENTKDYLEGKTPMIKELCEVSELPKGADIQSHLRMMYGHVDWDNLIVEVTPELSDILIKNAGRIARGLEVLGMMMSGQHVALLDFESMGPVTYKELTAGSKEIELLDFDTAVERAAHWFVEDLLEFNNEETLFTEYFIVAYRLALLGNCRDEDERFSSERLNDEWRKTLSKVMMRAGQKLTEESFEIPKSYRWIRFQLDDDEVEEYLKNI